MPLVRRLGVLVTLLVVAGTWSGSALSAGEPANTSLPTIAGRAQVGHTLTADPGTWTGSPTSFAYQWQKCSFRGSGCVDIAGGTALSYVVAAGDAGSTFAVAVTATNAAGSTKVTSAPSFVVTSFSLGTAHFVVHYMTDPATDAAITMTTAGDIAAFAERAYAAELADGYPAPLSDGTLGGDSRTDIYVENLSSSGALGLAIPDVSAGPASGYFVLDGSSPDQALDQLTIAHELFHLIQFGIWLPSVSDYWLLEGSAEWIAYKADGFRGDLDLGNWDMALDCRDPTGMFQCDLDDSYKNGGYSRWPFFEYVTERWGAGFVKSIFDQGAAGAGSATAALSNAVAAKGTTLADTFTAWTLANLTGAYSVQRLQGIVPPTYGDVISTGSAASLNLKTKKGAAPVTSGAFGPVNVAVNHLSVRYVAFRRGDAGSPDAPCYKATLGLDVALPAGTGAKPYFWWSQKNPDGTSKESAQPLSISGSTASISVPWDTCDWSSTLGYLVLPNPTTDLDGRDFSITGTISIDTSTEATATPPPDPVSMPGTTIDVPNGDGAPRIEVFGPELIRLSATSRTLRLIVSSSGAGRLQASLGSLSLGTAALRAGSNDVRLTLPAPALRSLRRTSAAANVLTLTPLSKSGVAGKSVVRRVSFARPVTKRKVTASAGSHR